MQYLMVVTAAVTPITNDVPTLQSVIGFLIMVLLGVISFFVGRLYKSIGQLYDLINGICKEFAELKGEHKVMMEKGGHK